MVQVCYVGFVEVAVKEIYKFRCVCDNYGEKKRNECVKLEGKKSTFFVFMYMVSI